VNCKGFRKKTKIRGNGMAKYLVIVESPAKVKTIKKFLGTNYEVLASNGHVRDMPKSQLGFDAANNYEPKYITIRGKGDILAKLRKEVKKAEKVYLATDPDREGEAISWHLYIALKLEDKKVYRITFNEITKNAVKESLKNPREIDMNLVDAQQARRMLDRMVGYRISPLLWAKIKRGLSAGRVQSVALRIICDREAEIDAFIPEEYWTLDASLNIKGEKKPLVAKYYGIGDKKTEIKSKEEMDKVLADIKDAAFSVVDIKNGERVKKAPLPFTTSTLQQEASKQLNFSTQKTMRLAQQLYEDGIITYLRTDSTRVSDEAVASSKAYISENFGDEYCTNIVTEKKSDQKIQDAHEAIRPTDIASTPTDLKETLSRDLFRLYQLIWKRFTASRMSEARYNTVSVKIDANGHRFTVSASKLAFDGFMSVYKDEDEDKAEPNTLVKDITKDTKLTLGELEPKQHFTQPPAHYTEASLVRALEELGIGRPSTYAPTITTILGRRYIIKEDKNLYVSELGEVVNNMMVDAFPSIVDVNFTANLEALLDKVEAGTVDWKTVVSNFYPDLEEAVKKAENELEEVEIKDEVSDEVCDVCGRNMVIKYGPHGKFLACPGFPECRNTKPYFEKIGVTCPKCGKEIVVKKTKKGRKYYGCEANPECDFMVWQRPAKKKCEKCGNVMFKKGNRLVCANEQCGFTEKVENDEQN
jgi:DNA topoisomerase-1